MRSFRHLQGEDFTEQKMKFSIKDFFSKYDQICRKLRIWSHLLKISLMENLIFCAVLSLVVVLNQKEKILTNYQIFFELMKWDIFSASVNIKTVINL